MRQALVLLVIGVIVSGCTENDSMELADFTSDGCSLFIDGTFENPELWKECCLKHDIAYWQGGTKEQRKQADLAFKNCVEKDGRFNTCLFNVRGSPCWRRASFSYLVSMGVWLACWSGEYKELTLSEKKVVEEKLKNIGILSDFI